MVLVSENPLLSLEKRKHFNRKSDAAKLPVTLISMPKQMANFAL